MTCRTSPASQLGAFVTLLLAFAPPAAHGDVLVLASGGRVEGRLLNAKKGESRDKYVIETAAGRLTLDKSQVKEVIEQSASKDEYEKVRRQYPDTAEGQLELALWCRDHDLPREREKHLQRVIELDANNAEAHRLLKHLRDEGGWKTQRQFFEDRGYVEYLGQWMTPQERDLKEESRKTELAEKDWKRKLKQWRGWLDGPRAQEALDQIGRITDPFAIKALGDCLTADKVEEYRKRYIEALARIDAPAAWRILCERSLMDADEEVRLTCLDYITERPSPALTDYFVGRLHDKENTVVNRAGQALGKLKDRKAIAPLIEALMTDHIFQIAPEQPNMTSGIGSFNGAPASGAFSVGNSGPKVIKKTIQNEDVLQALVDITGGQNYLFNRDAWKAWHASQKKAQSLNARRDEH
ncbi:MAG TPA: HEAT repeat domain-containing protein [Pirellulales bacterium]|nr:HEAT repeat domain-containing protein [Pirellulales bacterium]